MSYKNIIHVAIILLMGCSANASQTITLSLETPTLPNSNQSQPVPKKQQQPKQNTVKVGLVGMVQTPDAKIYKSKSTDSKVYTSTKIDTPLAIVKQVTNWFGIMMANGSIGWIQSKDVKTTGYDLMAPANSINRGSYTSRGGSYTRNEIVDNDIIHTAMQYSGVPYVYGGTNPDSGMDCSAFVRSVFSKHGTNLPRTARSQSDVGSTVPFDQLQPGDRLYFSCKNSYIDHCGIYAGNGYFIHCSVTRKGVGIDSLTSDFFWRSLVVAKRS